MEQTTLLPERKQVNLLVFVEFGNDKFVSMYAKVLSSEDWDAVTNDKDTIVNTVSLRCLVNQYFVSLVSG